jgi:tetratricopeptide (TPR) repeat protein
MRLLLIFVGVFFCVMCAHAQKANEWKALEVEGDTLMSREDYEGALVKYNEVAKITRLKDPQTYIIFYKRGICLYSLEEFEQALGQVDQFLKQQPDFDQAKLLRAFIGRELGDTQIQLSSLSDLLLHDPRNLDLLKWRATTFIDAGLYPEARRDIVAAQKINNDAELEGYIGIAYYYEDKPDSAIAHFDKAISLDKMYVTSYLYAGSLCLDEEVYELALEYINQGLLIEPSNSSLQLYKGIALVQNETLDEGCRILAKVFYAGADDAGDYLKEFCYR